MSDLEQLRDEVRTEAFNVETCLSNAESRGADQEVLDALAEASAAMDRAVELLPGTAEQLEAGYQDFLDKM
jgi:hypothetical protein